MLSEDEDAYGHAMLDYLEGRPAEEIVERDDGYIYLGAGPSLYFAPYAKWRPHERCSMRYVRGRVLDLGCGAGRALLHLRDKGLPVAGIDNSPLALEVCRRRGLVDVFPRSVEQLEGLGVFDTVLLLASGFGLFGNRSRALRLLRTMHVITSKSGRIIATSRDPYEDPDAHTYIQKNLSRERMGGQFRIRIRYRAFSTPWWDYLTVSKNEFAEIVEAAGWEVRHVVDGPEGRYASVLRKA